MSDNIVIPRSYPKQEYSRSSDNAFLWQTEGTGDGWVYHAGDTHINTLL